MVGGGGPKFGRSVSAMTCRAKSRILPADACGRERVSAMDQDATTTEEDGIMTNFGTPLEAQLSLGRSRRDGVSRRGEEGSGGYVR